MPRSAIAADAARQAHLRPRHGIPRRGQTSCAAYFERTGLSQRDSPRMYFKTAVLLLWFGASYALLVFGAATVWQGALLSLSLGLAMAGHRLRHPARRQPRRLLEPRRRQPRDGDDARHAGRQLVPLALQAQPRASHLHQPGGRGRRHQLRPLRPAVAGAAALAACTASSSSICGRCTGSCSRSGTSSTTSRAWRRRESPGTRSRDRAARCWSS